MINKSSSLKYSSVITSLRFPLILFVIFLHCYTSTNLIHGNAFWANSYVFSLILGESGVPTFFFISGFLFFINSSIYFPNFKKKLTKRFHTLFIPYIFWNCLTIILYVILQTSPVLKSYFSGNNKAICDYKFIDYIRAFWDNGSWNNGNGTPILNPYWYVRNLMILSLLTPVIYYIIKKCGWVIIIPFILWMNQHDNAFALSSISFFSLGALFSIKQIDIWNFYDKTKSLIFVLYFVMFVADFISHVCFSTPINLQIHRITLIISIFFYFKVADMIKSKIRINTFLSDSSFFIYTIHYPIMLGIRKLSVRLINSANDFINILLYFTDIAIVLVICLIMYYLLHKYCPRLLAFSTGNRA